MKWKRLAVATATTFTLAGVAYYAFMLDRVPPQLVDLGNPKATYTILALEDMPFYQLLYQTDLNKDEALVIIGSSPVPLEPFIDRQVKLTGKFAVRAGREIFCRPQEKAKCLSSEFSTTFKAVVLEIEDISPIN
uniref:Uncharacterized protein n=1 Tax=Oscillatoriales cyanobacterium SpSt-402 TaxID=2282168 RepID=A0A832M5D9_9CYAN